MSKNKIAVLQCHSYDERLVESRINALLSAAGFDSLDITAGSTVLIKANLGMANTPDKAATTHPAVVRAIVREVKRRGGNPIVGDDPIVTRLAQETMEITGMVKIAKEEDVKLSVFAKDGGFVKVKVSKYKNFEYVYYAKNVLDADIVISVPKLKTHLLTMLSCSVKNMMGCVERTERKRMHEFQSNYDFSKALVEVFKIRPPDFTVVDGVTSMVGLGPSHGIPADTAILMASKDGLGIDVAAAKILGYDPTSVETIKLSLDNRLWDENMYDYPLSCLDAIENAKWPLVPKISDEVRKRFKKFLLMSLEIDEAKCIGCGDCIQHCPVQAMAGIPPRIDLAKCISCFCCFELCSQGAVVFKIPSILGKHDLITKEQVIEKLSKGEGL